jgi:predicted transcriptional regulator
MMTVTIELSSETENKLMAWAAATSKDVSTLVREAVEEKLQAGLPTFQEILAPVHEEFRRSGMREEELDNLLESTLAGVHKERRERRNPSP